MTHDRVEPESLTYWIDDQNDRERHFSRRPSSCSPERRVAYLDQGNCGSDAESVR